jgi:signal transduction histidine kinase
MDKIYTKMIENVAVQSFKVPENIDTSLVIDIGHPGRLRGLLSHIMQQTLKKLTGRIRTLKESDKARREFIANICHDLRTPITAIHGHLESILLKEASLTAAEKQRSLQIALNKAELLSKMVGDLFELSKFDAEEIDLHCEPFSIMDLAQDVLLTFSPSAGEKRIRLRAAFPKSLPFIYGDIAMIERVLSNLMDNALRHTPEHGEITIKMSREQNRVLVSVCDSGCGIPAVEIPHIFQRAYRVKRHARQAHQGLGLGLAIAHKIIEAHQGRIYVESVINEGTTFTLELETFDIPKHSTTNTQRKKGANRGV